MKKLLIIALTAFTCGLFGVLPINAANIINQASMMRSISSMPLAFTQNNGQWPDSILYRANAGGATMWFTPSGAYYQFTRRVAGNSVSDPLDPDPIGRTRRGLGDKPDSLEIMMLKASFVGANPNPKAVGLEEMEYKCNCFFGNDPAGWRTDVPNYESITFKDIYSGIDLKYYGSSHRMEYDFLVSPGADYAQIQIHYEGAKSLSVNKSGELVVETGWGKVTEMRPNIYQIENGKKRTILGVYCLLDKYSFGFRLDDNYDPTLAVVIDPVLSYSTYLGGSVDEYAYGIAVDGSECAYLTGYTISSNFPTQNPYDATLNGNTDAFITKMSASGSGLVYSTYLGGGNNENGYAIAVDGSGCAYVTGYTRSSDFPTQNPYDNSLDGSYDVFITKLSATGNSLEYSTYLGGGELYNEEAGHGIAVDGSGCAFVTGVTLSSDFPMQNPYNGSYGGNYEAFITKLSAAGNTLVYSTYLGGGGDDNGYAIAVDGSGCTYVTGYTTSSDFPMQSPYDNSFNGSNMAEAFVTKLSTTGNSLEYSTYLGGGNRDIGCGIAVDGSGCVYITGYTLSSDFPTQNAYNGSFSGGYDDAFVTKLSSAGNTLVYSTYLGGGDYDEGYAIAVDGLGYAYVTGQTHSSNFPTQNPYDGSITGARDAFVTKLSAAGNGLMYSTFLGGGSWDYGYGIAVDGSGGAYVTGYTLSSDFPTQNAYDGGYNGSYDAFVVKFAMNTSAVSNLNDNGPGSLRQALVYDNTNSGPDTIIFSISGTINLTTQLPAIIDDSTIILGSTAPGGAHSVIIDGSGLAACNGLVVQSRNNKIEGLTIRNFPGCGIEVSGALSVNNMLTNNLIYNNAGLAIDLNNDGVTPNDPGDADTGPNNLLNYPVKDTSYTTPDSDFVISGHASDSSIVEFYLAHPNGQPSKPEDPSGHGEAYTYIGSDTCDESGVFGFIIPKSFGNFSRVSAIAIDTLGNTSEFSDNLTLIPSPLIIVAYSPVNLWITDPDGYYIGKDALGNLSQTITTASYDEVINDSVTIYNPIQGQYEIVVIPEADAPTDARYGIGIRIDGSDEAIIIVNAMVPPAGTTDTLSYVVEEGWHFINGDANRSGVINALDVTYLINYLYKHGPAPNPLVAGDANCNGVINALDVTRLINFLYKHGSKPCQI